MPSAARVCARRFRRDHCWISARCGIGAPLVIQVKISGKRVPEIVERRKHGKLVREHVRPHRFKSRAMGHEGLERRHRDRLVSAFLPEHVEQDSRRWPAVRMPIEVHHVVEIAWSRPFSERAQFFAERFFIGIAIGPYALLRASV